MSVLDKYAKPSTEERRDVSAAVRLEKSLLDRFTTHCKSRGLTVSEAIRYLIIEALEDVPEQQIKETAATVVERPKKTKKTSQSKRPTVTAWLVNDKLPCPICNDWFSRSNFARDHAKPHGYETAHAFLSAHGEKSYAMVEEYKNATD